MEITQTHRLNRLFEEVKQPILSVYFTAGYPQLDHTMEIIKSLAHSGVDLIEVGMPYSDPIADGPVIQQSNHQALENGMSVKLLLEQLTRLREETQVPVILMGYINPIIQYGVPNFCHACQKIGIDGLILPDLPLQEYQQEYRDLFVAHGLHNILLITPQTSAERIQQIDENSQSFIYAVSDASITGASSEIQSHQLAYFKRLQSAQLQHPHLIGFGIHDHKTFSQACTYASGAIIGSAFIRALKDGQDLTQTIPQFVHSIKNKAS